VTSEQLNEKLRANKSLASRNAHLTGGVASNPQQQCDPVDEPVAEDAGEIAYQGRCLVRITSFRVRLLDTRNLWDKHFVDALVESQILFDDSPKHAQIEVDQIKVSDPSLERTEIVIEKLPQ